MGFTKPYEYSESDPNTSPSKKNYVQGGFRYDEDPSRNSKNADDGQLSPNSQQRRATALAFNYAPGEDSKLKESAGKLKSENELSPRTRDKILKGELSPKTKEKLLKEGNLSPKTRAKLEESRSYSPNSGKKPDLPGTPGTYKPIDPTTAFIKDAVYEKAQQEPAGESVFVPLGGGNREEPKKKKVKIMVIISRLDPKTRKLDLQSGEIEHSSGILDTETGKIETKYGVIDPKNSTIDSVDPRSGQTETFVGQTDPKTGQLYFINGGVVNPETGTIDDTMGQVISIAHQDNPVVEITTITSKLDPATGKVDTVNGEIEKTRGILNLKTSLIETKYGKINPHTGAIEVVDPKSGKVTKKQAKIDKITGQITIIGLTDPKSNKLDPYQAALISVGNQIDPIVEVLTVAGKLDRKGAIDPKLAVIEASTGQVDLDTGKIDTKYGQFDLNKHTLTYVDPKTGKTEVKDIKVDPLTGQILLKNQVNPKTGKPDKDYGRIISLKIVHTKVDPASGKIASDVVNESVKLDPKTNQIWVPSGKDPKTNETVYSTSHVDPKTGFVITIYGYLNTKTNEIEKQNKVDPNLIKVDPQTGQIFTATGDVDEQTGEPIFATSQIDTDTGEVYTKIGKVDPKTGKLVLIKVLIITRKDERGKPKEIDPSICDIDPDTGKIKHILDKTLYVYKMIDPVTGEMVNVDPNDPRIAGARTTVTQTMTLTGEIDKVTGRIKSEYGHIDPNTGDIDPATAVKDPITGKLILNYADIDPSHFGKDVTTIKETVPITRQEFFDGIKHLGKNALKRDSESDENDDDDDVNLNLQKNANNKNSTPTVVKTTTKQVITKNDDGVTHNVQEEVQNLGTGEITYSTQEHKVCTYYCT